jgi:hypothetical protein
LALVEQHKPLGLQHSLLALVLQSAEAPDMMLVEVLAQATVERLVMVTLGAKD